jgi:ubiquilin
MAESIKVTIRQNSGQQFDVTVAPTATVKELKVACQEGSGISADEMRLIFKGKILKDENTLDSYKIEEGVTVHLVKGKSAASGSNPTETSSSVGTSQASSSS